MNQFSIGSNIPSANRPPVPQSTQVDVRRLHKLISYYLDGWNGFSDTPYRNEREVMVAIQALNAVNLNQLTRDEVGMAQTVLAYGADVSDRDLAQY